MTALSNPKWRRTASRAGAAFTLVEILVSAVLLTLSLSAVIALWSVSRSTTERSRDTAEYYVVARQEAERYRTIGAFSTIFDSFGGTPPVNTPLYADYGRDEFNRDGVFLGTVTAKNAEKAEKPRQRALYRVESTFYLQPGSAGDTLQMLGVHAIRVFLIGEDGRVQNDADDVYRTALFFSAKGV